MAIQIGQQAPGFETTAVVGKDFAEIDLASYRGKWVVLFFYPLDFTFVCPTEITAFSDGVGAFREAGAEVLGCSVDSQFSHLAWVNTPRNQGGLGDVEFPLLADLTKSIGRDYGVLDEAAGITYRGVFIIDPEGKIRFQLVHDLGVGRNPQEVLRVLQAIQYVDANGEVCPVGWEPGDDTMKPDPIGSRDYFQNQ